MAEFDQSENRQKTGRRKAPITAFKPGQSGNPGGRPKRTQQEYDLMAACGAMTPEALKTIVNLMLHADKDSVRLSAAMFIIERRYGKSVERKETRVGPLDDATTAELLEMKRIVRLRLEHRSTPEAVTAEEGVWVSPSRNP
jgi:hypothetical protein